MCWLTQGLDIFVEFAVIEQSVRLPVVDNSDWFIGILHYKMMFMSHLLVKCNECT